MKSASRRDLILETSTSQFIESRQKEEENMRRDGPTRPSSSFTSRTPSPPEVAQLVRCFAYPLNDVPSERSFHR